MGYKKFLISFMAVGLTLTSTAQNMDTFISNLMSRMTLEEKIGQLNQLNGGDIVTGGTELRNLGTQESRNAILKSHVAQEIMAGRCGSLLNIQGVEKIRQIQEVAVKKSRLGIPLLIGLDVIHGYETLFPVPLGLSCTWDMEAIRQSAHIAAVEAGTNGIGWTFSPMVDISLDSRWGRVAESAGEDPYLGSQIAKAMVEGYQSPLPTSPFRGGDQSAQVSPLKGEPEGAILACVKHFALYGAAESGRDYNTVDMSRLRMYQQYFPPYKAALEAGAGSFMSSFNIVDGMPASGNKWLMTEVLRNQWGFKGFVVTDYATIPEMKTWGVGSTEYRNLGTQESRKEDDKANTARALKAGCDMDMVSECYMKYLPELVKENKGTPLKGELEGAIDKACRRVLEAKYKLGLFDNPYKFCDAKKAKQVTYCQEHRDIARKITAESFVLLKNDTILPFGGDAQRAEGGLLPLKQGTKVALIGPMADNREDIAGTWSFSAKPEKYKTVKEALSECKDLKLVGACQGCNVLDDSLTQQTVSEGHGIKPVPWVDEEKANAEALALAEKADVVVCCMGEVAWMSGEGTSRSDLEMPAPQRRLLMKLKETGKPIVLLNFAGRATCLSWESENLPAIMNVWFGSECGDAIADVLSGKEAPSGHLTVSMPKSTGQEPLYYNQLNTGRPVPPDAPFRVFSSNYIDVHNGALYPFGYGSTYTTFSISESKVIAPSLSGRAGGESASCVVTNTGQRDGDAVVQLYIHHKSAEVALPVKELKGFQRIHLKAGEKKTVTFQITEEMRQYYALDDKGNPTLITDHNPLDIMIGLDSENVQLTVNN